MQIQIQAQTLQEMFLNTVDLALDKPALYVDLRHYTYGELLYLAKVWGGCVINALPNEPNRVGILASRNITSYAAVVATLLMGASFVPLSVKQGTDRVATIVHEAELDVIFVDRSSLPFLKTVCQKLKNSPLIVCPDIDRNELSSHINATFLSREDMLSRHQLEQPIKLSPDDVAYILFTSGSTGKPKGVPILHRNVLYFLSLNQQRYQLTPDDRLSQTFDLTFDLAMFDLFMAWGAGACVCSFQPIQLLSPFKIIREQHVTVWFSVPSVAHLLQRKGLLRPSSLASLKWSLFCGEPLTFKTAEAWKLAAPNSIVENLYGPTELTLACSVYRLRDRDNYSYDQDILPIGQIYSGLKALIVDAELNPVKPEEPGELCVSGPQTFPGYLKDEASTKKNFFETADKTKYFRTGDLVRSIEGNISFLGRIDHQIKVMGYRIEPQEIEFHIRQFPGVHEAIVVPYPPEARMAESLTAFIVGNNINVAEMTRMLSIQLPSYMVPKNINLVDEMPLNNNGKIDRVKLKNRM
ncbi:amino acid adenylation domain-containing protein [Alicyclobacillus sp. SO9]|uniref:amino acid adenylation domain-containing protein n=1 Tax=Alicyclobacillus sp. SO9 TaxID=2665646 RepID=UPI0018E818C3|nr:amino acid adenylation domain-containing protein [Alicyclobacillus sp. SO9]QQE79733.1 amino acid adenylation domain-containing protein [Alicyclobacillus sp. SO9]